nr:structural protein 1 [Chaphamaparvovirus sp.]
MFLLNRIGNNTSAISTTGMAESMTFKNSYMVYIKNSPMIYPNDDTSYNQSGYVNTGWHIIPNFLWCHVCTPKQWLELITSAEAYTVTGVKCTLFNMIPMTTQLAIQGTSIFTAFNNTIYALGYIDRHYETNWQPWMNDDNMRMQINLLWKEGLGKQRSGNSARILQWPIYQWAVPYHHVRTLSQRTWAFSNNTPGHAANQENLGWGVWPTGQTQNSADTPSGLLWDPFNEPSELQELRPGKNAISFHWNPHEADTDKWFNTDQLAWWFPWTADGPYYANTRPGTYKLASQLDPDKLASRFENNPHINDYTIANWANLPITPTGWFWEEMKSSIITDYSSWEQRPDFFFPGTEYELYKYPIHQWFTKMIPLFNSQGTLVDITANVSVQIEVSLKTKKRRSAIYCPTAGPFAWKNIYSAQTDDTNFINAYIRYRTGGARRTWQNMQKVISSTPAAHPREDPYQTTTTIPACNSGLGGTFSVTYTSKQTTTEPTQSMDTTPTPAPATSHPLPVKRRAKVHHTDPLKDIEKAELPINSMIFKHITDTQL